MKSRELGSTGIFVSEIGFGCWGIGGEVYGLTRDEGSLDAIRTAVDLGINFFDTSDFYGAGKSEDLLGRAFVGIRDRVVIASKVGLISASQQDFSEGHLRSSIEGTLGRLQTDYLDLYQLHNPPPALQAERSGVFRVLDELKKQGKIRQYGVSAKTPEEAMAFVGQAGIATLQVNFNLMDQRCVELGLFAHAAKERVGIIARTPLCFGFLTGKYGRGTEFSTGDHRNRWPRSQQELWHSGIEKFLEIHRGGRNETRSQFALSFCLSYPEVSTTIPGMLTPDHVLENARACDSPAFTAEQRADLLRIYAENSFFVNR